MCSKKKNKKLTIVGRRRRWRLSIESRNHPSLETFSNECDQPGELQAGKIEEQVR